MANIELVTLPDERFEPREGMTHVLLVEADSLQLSIPFAQQPTLADLAPVFHALAVATERHLKGAASHLQAGHPDRFDASRRED